MNVNAICIAIVRTSLLSHRSSNDRPLNGQFYIQGFYVHTFEAVARIVVVVPQQQPSNRFDYWCDWVYHFM